jgi:hypothetical protein
MYMRAEARRASESSGVAVAPPPRRRNVRRMQLATLAALWLLIAGVTTAVGLLWERASRPAQPAVESATLTPPPATPATTPTAPPVVRAADTRAPAVRVENTRVGVTSAQPAAQPTATERPSVPSAHIRDVAAVSTAATTPAPVQPTRRAAPVRLVIRSTPPGAFVTVDGIGWGATPTRIGYLPPGVKHVRVTKDGFAAQERTIDVGDGTATLNIALRPAEASNR